MCHLVCVQGAATASLWYSAQGSTTYSASPVMFLRIVCCFGMLRSNSVAAGLSLQYFTASFDIFSTSQRPSPDATVCATHACKSREEGRGKG